MLKWLMKRLGVIIGAKSKQHTFEPAISLRGDDGRLGVLRCVKCGYCTYLEHPDGAPHPPCIPRAHKWMPVKVFQWEHLALANRLPEPLQCALCGAHASTYTELERLGCPGHRSTA
jgi:hypothetical protein